jgi:Tfp pilus assembly protein PilO
MTGVRASLLRRIVLEKRAWIVPLVAALLVNAGVYAFVVYPLRVRVDGAAERARQAEGAMRGAERQLDTARAALAGQRRAEDELKKFYDGVLPGGFSKARRVLYLRVSQIARQSNLQYKRESFAEPKDDDKRVGALHKLTVSVVLEGSYENVRTFIHQIETAPEFVVIENVSLAMRNEGNAPLVLTLVLSTYYRDKANAP